MLEQTESITAKICAFVRAYHSNTNRKKIFDDYLAFDLMGKEEYENIRRLLQSQFAVIPKDTAQSSDKVIGQLIGNYIEPVLISRIAFAEARLDEFVKRNGICQYVICGAGFDTYSFRNANPSVRIFEIDHPNTQRSKLKRIQELRWNTPGNVRFIPVDFEKENMKEKLLSGGFDPSQKTFFSILGVAYYLSIPVFEETVASIASLSSEGSVLVFDYPDHSAEQEPESRLKTLKNVTEQLGETMSEGFDYAFLQKVLERDGFHVNAYLSPKTIQKTYFSGRSDSLKAFKEVHFIEAILQNNKGDNQ